MKKKLEMDRSVVADVQLLTVRGMLDMAAVSGFEQTLDEIILHGGRKIVVDLSQVEYISSAGLGALIGRIRDLRNEGGDLKVGGYHPRVFEVMKLIGFTDIFEVYPSSEAAIKKF